MTKNIKFIQKIKKAFENENSVKQQEKNENAQIACTMKQDAVKHAHSFQQSQNASKTQARKNTQALNFSIFVMFFARSPFFPVLPGSSRVSVFDVCVLMFSCVFWCACVFERVLCFWSLFSVFESVFVFVCLLCCVLCIFRYF